MDVQQKIDVRKAFKLRVHESNGNAFENLFCDIMRASNSGFNKVKPQGQIGDRKNDGFIAKDGIYYQVYAPETVAGNLSSAIKKLEGDLTGLLSYWRDQQGFNVDHFYFVFNDKYLGAYPELYATLNDLKKKFNLQTCDVLLAPDLEDIFLSLDDDHIASIIGYYPKIDDIGFIDNAIISEIVGSLSQRYQGLSESQVVEPPDFDNKIKFNKLGKATARHLNVGAYQYGFVEDYFRKNSKFSRQEARNTLHAMYKSHLDYDFTEAVEASGLSASDIVFKNMVDELMPDNILPPEQTAYERNIIAVLAFFFEACDIFEEPPQKSPKVELVNA